MGKSSSNLYYKPLLLFEWASELDIFMFVSINPFFIIESLSVLKEVKAKQLLN